MEWEIEITQKIIRQMAFEIKQRLTFKATYFKLILWF